MKKFKSLTRVSRFMFFICIVIFITCVVFLCLAKKMQISDSQITRLVFILCQSIMMEALILMPLFFRRLTHLVIPTSIEVAYVIFCAMCLILGEMAEFYNKVSWWDSMLHTLSGVLLGIFGYIVINTIDKSPHNSIHLTPFFSSCLILIFVMSCGYLWEILEWWSDEIFGSNMQRYLIPGSATIGGGEPLVGHAALADTMKDLQLNLIGGLFMAVYGYIEMKRKKKGITTMVMEPVSELIQEEKADAESKKLAKEEPKQNDEAVKKE